MEGRWGDAGELLHAKIVTDGAEVDLAGLIRRNRRALRQAYRDAGLEHVEINGEAAKLTISWGRRGFEERDLRARRDGDGWRFASPPWGRRIVRQPGKKIVQTKPARRARTKPSYFGGFSVGGAMVLAWVGILSAFVLAVCLYGLFGSILSLARGPAIAFSVAVFAGVAAVAVIVHRRHRTRRRRSHGDPMSFSYHPAGQSAGAWARERDRRHAEASDDSIAVRQARVVGEGARRAVDAHTPVSPLPPEYNASPPVLLGCVLTIVAFFIAVSHATGPGVWAGLATSSAFFVPVAVYTVLYLRRKRRWMQATVEGKFERWQRPDGKLARLEKRTRPGFSGILLKALVLSLVFILPALSMMIEVFGGEAREAFGGIALSAFLAPFPVAYAIHKSTHEPE